jgi:hypothetical protein
MQLRGMTQESIKAFPEIAWDNLFLHQQKHSNITITTLTDENISTCLEISTGPANAELTHLSSLSSPTEPRNLSELLLENEESDLSILNFTYKRGNQTLPLFSLVADLQGISVQNQGRYQQLPWPQIYFLHAASLASSKTLAEYYNKCYLAGHAEQVKQALQVIDPSIVEVIGKLAIYLSRKDKKPMPLVLFGDSLNRVAELVLAVLNCSAGIVLIDEIEQSVHHVKHKELWQWLFDMTANLNVQLFATTHSLEMLKAFLEVSLATEEGKVGSYFEFARHVKTQEVIGIKYEMNILDYALKRSKGVRGD